MNYYNACNILNLSNIFNNKELKHNYYLKALQYHPDKNSDINAKMKFQEVLDAYIFLNKYKDIFDEEKEEDQREKNNSYLDILENFLGGVLNKNIDTEYFLSILNNKSSEISIELLNHFSKNTLLKFHNFVNQYFDILHINKDIKEKLEELITDYIKNDIITKVNPTLDNLINDEIYKLSYEDDLYYIPMWHHELVYELSGNSLIVQCEPQLPEYITIDQYNNLYVNLSTTVKSILNDNNITINIGEKKYIIPISELYIKEYQRYIFKREGISLIDTNKVYNVENKANIYVDIHFTDIK